MPNNIHILDETTANLIAAGEVIERPVSVVKELIENSLDAGADKIEVIFLGGGKKLIQVTDNGIGMNKSDALLALERHATSKIKFADDLFALNTLGFRGEALPSIAAVSHMEIITRTRSELSGTKVSAIGGKITDVSIVGASPGTTVRVKNLFFNTPARLHNQKSESSELARVSDLITRYALAYPNVAFTLLANQKLILSTSGDNNLLNTIATVYGVEAAEKMIKIKNNDEKISLIGYLGKPELNKPSRHFQTVIINGRYVDSSLISRSVERAYSTFLPINKYPFFFIKLNVPPAQLDVNIHPTKTRIKLLNEEIILKNIEQTVRNALLTSAVIPGEKINKTSSEAKITDLQFRVVKDIVEEDIQSYEDKKDAKIFAYKRQESVENEVSYIKEENKNDKIYAQQPPLFIEKKQLIPSLTFTAQLYATYWIGRDDSGNEYCIDQHAAHERVLYDKLMKEKKQTEVNVQHLLLPYIFDFNAQEAILLREYIDFLAQFGIEVSDLGGNTFSVRTIPLITKQTINESLMKNVLEKLISWGKINSTEELIHPFCTVLACRTAIKAGTKVSIEEFDHIWQQLKHTDNPYTCPHGRPTVIKLEKEYFDKKFKRI
ncbi:MAG TPA: DNA mismatch repair endonuclease MutL [Clostridia bacterium]|nr:DNA mismatch repair endonuclease MutL [Clostridia bacterium]